MTKEELIAKAKLRIRKSSVDELDKDVIQLVEVAIEDLKRIGVHNDYLNENDISNPIIIEAILLYVKSSFGTPEKQAELTESYNMMCTKIKGGGYHRSIRDSGN